METKMTSRDKLLLIVLGMILIVFGAVMIPKYGIKDLIVSIRDTRAQIAEQTITNEETLQSLAAAGISPAYAERPMSAQERLRETIVESKYDLVKMSQTSLSAEAYAVADKWLRPVKYLHFDAGNTELYASVAITNNEGGYVDVETLVGDTSYSVQQYDCTFSLVAADDAKYTLELNYLSEETNVDKLSLLIAAYNVLNERGSIRVVDWTFDEAGMSLNLVLTIPAGSKVDAYASEIGECHHCGKPYSIAEYNAEKAELDLQDSEEVVRCHDCDEPLTGEALH